MIEKPEKLVVLGSSITALAVVRDAFKCGLKTILVDTENGIAMSTRLAESHVLNEYDRENIWLFLDKITSGHNYWLIATSDSWLHFVIEYRKKIEFCFSRILHPSNFSLNICLDKKTFLEFCSEFDFLSPVLISPKEISENFNSENFPLLIRPVDTAVARLKEIPKAVEVYTVDEVFFWLEKYRESCLDAIITTSLINRNLIQISVGLARNGNEIISFTAIKRRPLPFVCNVGSYVELDYDIDADKIAHRALELLDYQGIAEVEILKDVDSNECFIIEINARPWVQYPLGPKSGTPLLAFMLDTLTPVAGKGFNNGCSWINFSLDLYNCFSKSVGHVRYKKISYLDWILSLLSVRSFSLFILCDLMPFYHGLRLLLSRSF